MRVLVHWKLILLVLVLGLGAGVAYLLLAEKQYEAEAKVQVVPLPAGDRTFAGFGLPRATDTETAAETVAELVETTEVIDPVAIRLRLDRDGVWDAVEAEAEGESDVVVVRARTDDPRQAAQLANALAAEFVSRRSGTFQAELTRTMGRLREQLRSFPASQRDEPPASLIVTRLSALEAYLGERDPTVEVAGAAVARGREVWPRPIPVLGAALLGSLALGLVAASLLALATRREAPAEVVEPEPEAEPATEPETDELAEREGKLAEREEQLDRRVQVITKRELTLVRRAGELSERERELEQAGTGERERRRDLDERERRADERVEELDARESGFAERERELAERERELAESARRAEEEAVVPEQPAPAPVAPPVAAPSGAGAWNLEALERLVAERRDDFPERADDWEAYLFSLRGHAAPDGSLPPTFDALVDEVFGELLASAERA